MTDFSSDHCSELVHIFSSGSSAASIDEENGETLLKTLIETQMRFKDPILRHLLIEGPYCLDFDFDFDLNNNYELQSIYNSTSGFLSINHDISVARCISPMNNRWIPTIHQPRPVKAAAHLPARSGLSMISVENSHISLSYDNEETIIGGEVKSPAVAIGR